MKTIVVAGTWSGVGKSTIAVGLMAAYARRGLKVQPFKIGPDLLDPLHHRAATGRESFNLDTWMLSRDANLTCFKRCIPNADIAIVEGVMGLYDGCDGKSEHGSTAEMAKLLSAPVFLVFDCWCLARSAAAMLHGYTTFDPRVKFAGVIFNKVSGPSHAACLMESLSLTDANIRIFGGIPNAATIQHSELKPELSIGDENDSYIQQLADLVELHLDLDAVLEEAAACKGENVSEALCYEAVYLCSSPSHFSRKNVRIGIARDAAFCFHYHENLILLQDAGAELVYFSPLEDSLPSSLDAIIFGGGYLGLHLDRLSANKQLLYAVRAFANAGGVVYGESGGLMYLSQGVEVQNMKSFPMSGVFPFWTRFGELMRSGYVKVIPQDNCVIFPAEIGEIRGFLYSSSEIFLPDGSSVDMCRKGFVVKDEQGTAGIKWEGYMQGNAMGSLVHLHFGSNPSVAHALVERCRMDRMRAAAVAAASASAVAGAGPVAAAAAGAAAAEAVAAALDKSQEILLHRSVNMSVDVKDASYQGFNQIHSAQLIPPFEQGNGWRGPETVPYSAAMRDPNSESAPIHEDEAILRRAESFDLHQLRRTTSINYHKMARSESEIFDGIRGSQRGSTSFNCLAHCSNSSEDMSSDSDVTNNESKSMGRRGKSNSADFRDANSLSSGRNKQHARVYHISGENTSQPETLLLKKRELNRWNCNGTAMQHQISVKYSPTYRSLESGQLERFPGRIVSLIPSATEILIELGAGSRLVGITDCCDRPCGVKRGRHIVGRSRVDAASLSKRNFETTEDWRPYLGSLTLNGSKLKLEVSWLSKVKPDLIVTQDSTEDVHVLAQAGLHSGKNTKVQSFSPRTVSEAFDSIWNLGDAVGLYREACSLVDHLRIRLRKVAAAVALQRRPRILLLQGLNPFFLGGHWIPEVEMLAGGFDGLQKPGCGVEMLHWQRIISYAPEVLVLSPCMLSIEQTLSEVELLARLHGFWSIPAVEARKVYICEHFCFSCPGPKMVNGVELLACILHPFAAAALQVQEIAWKLNLNYGQRCSPQDLAKHFKPCR